MPLPVSLQPSLILAIAAFLDYLIGDPWNWLHPVQMMGWAINGYSKAVLAVVRSPALQRMAGVVLGIGLVGLSGLIGWAIAWGSSQIHWTVAIAVQSMGLASCFAGRSLRDAAEDVLAPLHAGDLDSARTQLSRYVGRDTEALSADEMLRAVLETVTENATDGVMAPLFYAILGMATPVGSLGLGLAYKAASTLDSMVGYKTPPYTHLGWFSARMDDVLTWVPCRLTVLTLSLLSGRPRRVWTLCRRDAPQDPSPNAGWSECAYAAVLGVQMGGLNRYRGVVKPKPLLGDRLYPITPDRIHQAMGLTRMMVLVWVAIAIATHTSLLAR